jgi:hypothetical protein
MLKTGVGDGGFVKLVNAEGDEFDCCSGMLGFEESSFFSEGVFEVGVITKSDAQGAHRVSGIVAADLRGSYLKGP